MQIHLGKILGAGGGRPAQRLEQAGGNENRNVMLVETKQPGGFIDAQPRGRCDEGEKILLFLIHAPPAFPELSGGVLMAASAASTNPRNWP